MGVREKAWTERGCGRKIHAMSCASGMRRLGDPKGKTERDWVNAMGRNPVAISELAGGMRLLQWRSGTYIRQHVAVLFNAQHVFVKISSRYQC